jgi:DNA-binding response OmpR family regulator
MAQREKRVFIVEDEALVADMLEQMLLDNGLSVVGPAGTVAGALTMAETEAIDVAILDVNLRGERVDPVAKRLRARGIPIVFATGYGLAAVTPANGSPVICKPYTVEHVLAALAACWPPTSSVAAAGLPIIPGAKRLEPASD